LRKFFYVVTIVVLTPAGLVAAAVTLWLFTTTGNASVNVFNRSGTTLEHVVITSNGFRGGDDQLLPDGSFGFSATTEINFNFALAFEAAGEHHTTHGHVLLPPLGDYIISAFIDDQMRMTVHWRPTW
jgi:hypothetical protein